MKKHKKNLRNSPLLKPYTRLTKRTWVINLIALFLLGVTTYLWWNKWTPEDYIFYQLDNFVGALSLGAALDFTYLIVWQWRHPTERKKFINSLVCVLVVYCVLTAAVARYRYYVWRNPDESTVIRMEYLQEKGIEKVSTSGGYIVTEEWLAYNLYRIDSYVDKGDGTYEVFLISIEPATEETFEELKNTFYATPYSSINSYHIAEGIDCRGMTSYIAGWCQRHNRPYKISYTPSHTYITVQEDGKWYEFNFSRMSSIKEVEETEER